MPRFSDAARAGLVFGAVLWFSLPSLFLVAYVFYFHAPSAAIIPHLSLIAATLLAFAMVRFLVYRFGSSFYAVRFGSILSSGFFLILIVYYVIVLLGFEALGRVISWALVETYAIQLPELLHILGVPTAMVFMPLVGGATLIWFGFCKLYERYDFLAELSSLGSSAVVPVVFSLLSCIVFSQYWHLFDSNPSVTAEPVSLMLFPNKGRQTFQSHFINMQSNNSGSETGDSVIERDGPNVVLFVVDALRADHLAFNGYSRSTAPYLERLHQEGRLQSIPCVYSVCAESSCGLMALSSSRYVHQLGKASVTLQEVLRKNGYRINMVLGGDHTNFFGLRDAYGMVDEYYDGSMTAGRYYMNDDQLVIDKISSMPEASGRPSFFQFHLMSTHGLGSRDPLISKYFPMRNYYRDLASPSDEHMSSYINYYDNGILRADAVIRRILEEMEKKKYLDNALVLITADHGEMLGEHQMFSHAKAPFEPAIRVPLMIVRFGEKLSSEKIEFPEVASQIDIAPSVLFELGLSQPKAWSGIPLQKMRGDRRSIYFQQGAYYGLVDLGEKTVRWKYWVDSISNTERAYDLLTDSGEQNNRIGDIPATVKQSWRMQLMESQQVALDTVLRIKNEK
jgi:glucan phosphoethanolaminetransferase (alkaline phosphatase superfamily)